MNAFRNIVSIYSTGLRSLLRDRRALFVMALMPSLFVPLVAILSQSMQDKAAQSESFRIVTIAADAKTQATYRELIYRWFSGSSKFPSIKAAFASPELRPFLTESELELMNIEIENEEELRLWVDRFIESMRHKPPRLSMEEQKQYRMLPSEMRSELSLFREVAVQGLGLIKFIEPSSLRPVPDPNRLTGLEHQLPIDRAQTLAVTAAIKKGAVDAYLDLPEWGSLGNRQIFVPLLYYSARHSSKIAERRARFAIQVASRELVRSSFPEASWAAHPFHFGRTEDLSSIAEIGVQELRMLLPMFLILFLTFSANFAANDVGISEKAQQTLENLVISPVKRWEIATSKFLIVLTVSFTTSILGLTTVALASHYMHESMAMWGLETSQVMLVFSLLFPAAVLVSAAFLAISILAKSPKEANSMNTPVQLCFLFLAMMPAFPGSIVPEWGIYVPMLNVGIVVNQILDKVMEPEAFAVTMIVNSVISLICLWVVIRQFGREQVLYHS
ncbi:ABC transporter permease [Roseiconus lacunae]|uniref:ABC transporter permease n=1 Tax=Roseiconus lacunae TaxID=2605694 RepID=UPI0021BCF83F|nr:ABC transporter permease [Roseiconus lacunae]MCD0458148.1 ABC transporter permease subunit [Roseiconus lacunae]